MTKQSKPYISPVVYCLCYFINVTITVTLKSRLMIIYIGFLFNIGIGILSIHQKIGRQRACLTSWQLNRVQKSQQRRIYEIRCDLHISINNLLSVRVMSFFSTFRFLVLNRSADSDSDISLIPSWTEVHAEYTVLFIHVYIDIYLFCGLDELLIFYNQVLKLGFFGLSELMFFYNQVLKLDFLLHWWCQRA